MLTESEFQSFHHTGLLRLQRAVPSDLLDDMVERVWQLMAGQGIERDDPASWERVHAYFGIRGVQKLQALKTVGGSPEQVPAVREALDQIFAPAERQPAPHWGQALVTLPVEGEWLLPGNVWHFDHPCRKAAAISGVNVFLLMDDVEPGGGGTLVLENSPQVMAAYLATNPKSGTLSEQNKGFLRFDPWLAGLKCRQAERSPARNDEYMNKGSQVAGVPVRIMELTGQAGDVFITHPALLHAPAMNVRKRPRLMMTQRVRPLPDTE